MTDEEDMPESSNYRQQVQIAIEESILMLNQNSNDIPETSLKVNFKKKILNEKKFLDI